LSAHALGKRAVVENGPLSSGEKKNFEKSPERKKTCKIMGIERGGIVQDDDVRNTEKFA